MTNRCWPVADDQVDHWFLLTIVEVAGMLSAPAQLLGAESCLICGTPLSHLQRVQRDRFCGALCRGKYATLDPHQICVACGHLLTPHQYGSRVCASHECQRQ